jgi:oxygen-independent coproporphyrinogen-3 oxidase
MRGFLWRWAGSRLRKRRNRLAGVRFLKGWKLEQVLSQVNSNPGLEEARRELEVGEQFLAKYNRPGPRYTSYPTAPVWNDSFGPSDLEWVYEEANRAGSPVSLYMHIPFCESLCLFCACNVVIQKNKAVAPPYLGVLKQEIERVSRGVSRERKVVQFHWGGGTPTYLSPAQMEELFGFTRERFAFAREAEIGIEVDPRVTSREHLESLRRMGFNRLSMGIQDFAAQVQQAIRRIQPFEMTRGLIASARELGFDSINVDLIYGLPYQTADSFAKTVQQILELAPDRIALFSYAHVPWLKKQQGSFAGHLPEGLQKFEIFRTGLLKFLEAGYLYIGMDHFAKPGDELAVAQRERTLHRNFQGYTTKAGADLYGMGVTAISGIQNAYAQNQRDLAAWEKAVEERGIATMRGYRLSEEDRLRRAVISRLLCHTVVFKDEIAREFGIDFDEYFAGELERLEPARQDGLVLVDEREIRATWRGRVFIRNLGMVFDAYLENQQLDARPLFSKTL